ncbi:MAG TPA: class II aldolase/adducin family protein [Candidatus Hydrogenedentes bacterium]|jgi:L-fuculose-phosphate aldolase|nr:class II aldolase/adducin family protein [Candidatus Hydrogenedentota bacterium]HOD96107.1 class II aldolase/adducin family protein [Candidatus Hydrogenedentota bacterium]HOM47768.1 class II aldolase/adducin family protein [Candidatus Hydrogenedentota bacterium]HOR50931.1 class II aldolase/adducin family protein [Candidatus Hydrogenedentota bacterium]HPK24832.1 class II aldolase/adducin family protein [Candidatus Hydrogenedentota bacterium]
MSDIHAARKAVRAMGLRLLETGLVIGTWGNVSVRAGGKVVITPSGADYTLLQEEDMPVVDLETGAYEGAKPSSEKGLHLEVYRQRKEINAVIHVHSPHAATLAAARKPLPPILDDIAQLIGPGVRVADYALPSTKKIVRKTLRALKGRMAALMANHGAICLGRDLEEAYLCCQVLEKGCKAYIEAEFLGGAKGINYFEAALMHQFFLRKYSRQWKDKNPT